MRKRKEEEKKKKGGEETQEGEKENQKLKLQRRYGMKWGGLRLASKASFAERSEKA